MESKGGQEGGTSERDVLAYYPALLAFFRVRLSQRLRDDAEDLAQETMLAALRHLADGGERIRYLAAFLHGIGIKKLNDHLRRDKRHRQRQEALAKEHGALARRVAEAAAESRLEEAERQRAVGEALKHLSPDELEMIRLRCGNDELTNAEVAERLGIQAPAASRLFYRTKEKLYKLVGTEARE